MNLPNVSYQTKGFDLPQKLSSLGILGFILKDGIEVTTVDNKLTTEQVRAIAKLLITYPYRSQQEEIRKWAADCFNPEEKMTDEVRQYVETAQVDRRHIIDPFNLIKLSGSTVK